MLCGHPRRYGTPRASRRSSLAFVIAAVAGRSQRPPVRLNNLSVLVKIPRYSIVGMEYADIFSEHPYQIGSISFLEQTVVKVEARLILFRGYGALPFSIGLFGDR